VKTAICTPASFGKLLMQMRELSKQQLGQIINGNKRLAPTRWTNMIRMQF